jgi:glycosyltransferase involved in cell wall biosynthesis
MRIIFISSSSNKSGGSRQALYLAQGLLGNGHDLRFCVPADAELPELAPELPWLRLPEKRKHWRDSVYALLDESLGAGRPCILHAHHNKAVKLAAWWGLFWRSRGLAVFAQRGVVFPPKNPLPYWSPGIDCFMVNSQACAAVLRRKGVPERRLRVVYNAVPTARLAQREAPEAVRARLGLKDGELVFGCVANDSKNKGVEELLRAFARAELAQARLVVLGVSPDLWSPLARELGLSGRALLLPPCESVADHLRVFDAFVLSSHSESMPNTVQEAMCLGLPVLSTAVGGAPECVRGNGLLVAAKDVPGLAQGLRSMAESAEQRRAWGAKSLELSAQFDPKRKLALVESIYRETLERRGLRRP